MISVLSTNIPGVYMYDPDVCTYLCLFDTLKLKCLFDTLKVKWDLKCVKVTNTGICICSNYSRCTSMYPLVNQHNSLNVLMFVVLQGDNYATKTGFEFMTSHVQYLENLVVITIDHSKAILLVAVKFIIK